MLVAQILFFLVTLGPAYWFIISSKLQTPEDMLKEMVARWEIIMREYSRLEKNMAKDDNS